MKYWVKSSWAFCTSAPTSTLSCSWTMPPSWMTLGSYRATMNMSWFPAWTLGSISGRYRKPFLYQVITFTGQWPCEVVLCIILHHCGLSTYLAAACKLAEKGKHSSVFWVGLLDYKAWLGGLSIYFLIFLMHFFTFMSCKVYFMFSNPV